MARSKSLPKGPGRFTTSDDLSLWYRVAGRGPAMLVPTPGWGASADMYMKSLRPLEQKFTLIYLDTRGAGRSERPEHASAFYFRHFIDDIERLRQHLALDHWLLFVHSDATLQGLGYAIKHPRACHGLFIVGGTMNVDDRELDVDVRARMKKLAHEPWFAATKKAPPEADDGFRKNFLKIQLPLYFASATAARRALRYFSASTYHVKDNRYDDYADSFPPRSLAKVRARVAVIQGDADVITTPLEAIRIARHVPDSRLFVIRNAGHFPWLEQRNTFFRDFAEAAKFVLK